MWEHFFFLKVFPHQVGLRGEGIEGRRSAKDKCAMAFIIAVARGALRCLYLRQYYGYLHTKRSEAGSITETDV